MGDGSRAVLDPRERDWKIRDEMWRLEEEGTSGYPPKRSGGGEGGQEEAEMDRRFLEVPEVRDALMIREMLEGIMESRTKQKVREVERDDALLELVGWAEDITVAMAGIAGLNMTQAAQAAAHLVTLRAMVGTTSTEAPDDRPSKWPEGEGE